MRAVQSGFPFLQARDALPLKVHRSNLPRPQSPQGALIAAFGAHSLDSRSVLPLLQVREAYSAVDAVVQLVEKEDRRKIEG